MMKRGFFICLACLAPVALVLAFRPPPPVGVSQHVRLSTHIFVGTAMDLTVKDGKGNVLKPEPPALTNYGFAEMNVQVAETLLPSSWKTNTTVKVRFGGAAFYVDKLRKDFLGKKQIYLTVLQDGYFLPSYPWHLVEPLDARAEIEAAIKTNKPMAATTN